MNGAASTYAYDGAGTPRLLDAKQPAALGIPMSVIPARQGTRS
jgi:hypothetical protein